MIYLPVTHPKFSMCMELLASLPCLPETARFADLKDDLGLSQQDHVLALVDKLCDPKNQMRRQLRVVNVKGSGRMVGIAQSDWNAAQAMAQEYWNETRGKR